MKAPLTQTFLLSENLVRQVKQVLYHLAHPGMSILGIDITRNMVLRVARKGQLANKNISAGTRAASRYLYPRRYSGWRCFRVGWNRQELVLVKYMTT